MIKNLFLSFCLLPFVFTIPSQVKKASIVFAKKCEHLRVFEQAITSGDAMTATIALNYYLGEQNSDVNYADTLAMLYMQQAAYPQYLYWAEKRLQVNPDDNNLIELKGICLDKLQ